MNTDADELYKKLLDQGASTGVAREQLMLELGWDIVRLNSALQKLQSGGKIESNKDGTVRIATHRR